jgi:hypothetical protein
MKKTFINRVILWSLERFPPIQIVTAFLTFAIVCLPLGRDQKISLLLIHGTWIVLSVLLILRVLDEHKDFESDMRAHPDRLLQRKILTLSDLQKVAYFFAITSLSLISFFYFRIEVVMALVFLLVWASLMTKEFFVKEWLSEKLFTYSVSHLLISPLLIYFCATLATTENNPNLILMMLVSFFCAFSYEVARKIKGSDEVNILEMNYVNSYGIQKPLALYTVVSVLALLCSSQLVQLTSFKIGIYIFGIVYVFTSAVVFNKKPIKKFRKLNEASAATVGVISFLVPLSQLVNL